jgi:hypothetical protein
MIALTQVDFVVIRLICDLTVNFYTNYKFMRNKIYDRTKYYDLDAHQQYEEQTQQLQEVKTDTFCIHEGNHMDDDEVIEKK